jgi:hypothetical protein
MYGLQRSVAQFSLIVVEFVFTKEYDKIKKIITIATKSNKTEEQEKSKKKNAKINKQNPCQNSRKLISKI